MQKILRFLKKAIPLYLKARRHGGDLVLVNDRTTHIKADDVLAFVVLRNEAVRIPYFLDYYRKLGVNHFLFVDNDSNDGFLDVIGAASDCSVWHTCASYKEAKYGVYWLNYLLRRYGSGHWCLTLDPDEFLVYPYCHSRSVRELAQYLEQEGKPSFFTVMLDMYGEGLVDEALYKPGQDPLEVCPWFDASGYFQDRRPNYGEWWIRGGVRRRVFFADQPDLSPALNKTVLVKWRWYYAYIASTHIVWPKRLNNPHFSDTLAPTGCLLHFKYLAAFREKAEEELERKQHYAGSLEYDRYLTGLNDNLCLWTSASVRFQSWQHCVDLGLMNIGRWF
ncbi:MAG: glycosyltransferase family 2 protein [Methylovulum sp.]|uniref:glycosyltransferase family 2 protein n=1 Tax=Methylovulum sp. TaxID=1916980 RepID=UPI0026249C00|nr:glycosyltransferase family 2 protein [Methylovulum sp.]MDD2724968.1 glycosyltransferase family 2 protein [Methylovulum sp.]MDD5123508.1 glycosyltransferase family 2 protein [Methylovulum sp.]